MHNLYEAFEKAAGRYSDQTAVVFGQHSIPFRDLKESADRLASGLLKLHLQRGNRVAVMLPNVPHFPITYYALVKLGIQVVPLSIFEKSEEIRHQLEDAEVKGIIFWEGFRSVVQRAAYRLECCRQFVVLGEHAVAGEHRLTDLIEGNPPLSETSDVSGDDTALIVYTSGTTGSPKGAELTHANVLADLEAVAEVLKLSHSDSVVGVIPLYLPLGLNIVMQAFLAHGCRLILVSKFQTGSLFPLIRSQKPTYFIGSPSMYRELLKQADADPSDLASLKACVSFGDAVKEEIMETFENRFHVPILESYGLTEASPLVSINSPNRDRRPGSIGLPLKGIELKIINDSGHEVRPGQVGEIVVQGPTVMKGYLNRPEATKEAVRNGWLHTGDMARLDESGYGFIVVRKKNIIVKSGFSIYPKEVEKFISAHPAVQDAVVVGLPDPIMGEEIYACIVLKEGMSATQEEIIAYTKERMAAYKCPKSVFFAASLPKGPTGKLLRGDVRKMTADFMKIPLSNGI
ncbi:long-chain fatty acid--CoA ligase [bacterium]|nr:long-chain fatty acid--CoA ligase [bacterium]